jgi:hypothetical protein
VEAQRPRVLEAGLFLLVVALPLAFFPLSRGAFLDVKLLVLATGTLLCGSRACRSTAGSPSRR